MRSTPSCKRRWTHWTRRGFLGLLCLAAVAGSAAEPPEALQKALEQQACLRCHQMPTIAYRDPASGEIRDLHIDRDRFARSNHADLACTHCHEKDYRRYPHAHGSADENLHCVGCHDDDPKFDHYHFKDIEAQFERSVHARENPDGQSRGRRTLTCFSCHDPHVFRATQPGEDLTLIVEGHNRVCLACHVELRDPATPNHVWLPNREDHWRAVRCLDCHAPVADFPSHEVLPAGQGVRTCVDCHAKGATLLNQLYAYQSGQEMTQQGLISTAVFNRAYVVGMSRNRWVDRLALGLIGLTLLGLTAHGVGRYRAYRRTRRQA